MSIVFFDGFDQFDNVPGNDGIRPLALTAGYVASYSVGSSSDTRTGIGKSILINNGGGSILKRAFPTRNYFCAGFGVKCTSHSFGYFFNMQYDNLAGDVEDCFWLVFNDVAGISVIVNDGGYGDYFHLVAASAPNVFFPNTWYYMEVCATASAGNTGSIEVRVNGVTIIYADGIQTCRAGRPSAWNLVTLGSRYNSSLGLTWFDDFYFLNADGGGANPNSFLGDCVVHAVQANADVGPNDLTQFGGSFGHFTAINEFPSNEDSTYVYTTQAGAEERYSLSDFPNDVLEVLAMSVCVRGRKDSAGISNFRCRGTLGGATAVDGGHTLTTTYLTSEFYMPTKPGGGAWTNADAQALQIGFRTE